MKVGYEWKSDSPPVVFDGQLHPFTNTLVYYNNLNQPHLAKTKRLRDNKTRNDIL
jgi:hypothetical protein